jgi:hypothetical protein
MRSDNQANVLTHLFNSSITNPVFATVQGQRRVCQFAVEQDGLGGSVDEGEKKIARDLTQVYVQ